MSGMLAALAAPAALAALPAFDISPGSLTLQAGDSATGTVSNLPIAPDGQPGCIEAPSGTSIYLSVVFSPVCGGQAGWSSTMTIRTIPATPAGTYTIVFQVCPSEACSIPDIRNAKPIETKSWNVVVTAAPVPVETLPVTSPSPTSQTPRAAPTPTPSRSAPRTVVPTTTNPSGPQQPTATPATTPTITPAPSLSPALAGGVAPGLVLDHPAVKAGQTLRVSATGCSPEARATVGMPGASVTATTTAGPDGAFQVSLHLPGSLRAGRYPVVAECGAAFTTLVDVERPRSLGAAATLGLAAVVILLAGGAVGWFIRGRRVRGSAV